MAIKEKLRCEIDDKYKWDLSTMYKNDEDFHKDLEYVKEKIKLVDKYKGNITSSSDNLLNFLKYYFEIDMIFMRLFVYSNLRHQEDVTNKKYSEIKSKVDNLSIDISNNFSFIDSELLNTDYKIIKKYIDENKNLKEYEHYLDNIYRYQKHTLEEKEEKIISHFYDLNRKIESTYTTLKNSEIDFGSIKNEDGEKVILTNSNYGKFIQSSDRKVRKDAYKTLYKEFEKMNGTISSNFIAHLNVDSFISKEKNYNSSLDMYLFIDNIDDSIYNNLVDSSNENLDSLKKYYKLIKKILNLKELHSYDISAPISFDYNKKISYEEAKNIIIDGLSILGDDYISIIKKAFDERWIDVFSNKGKIDNIYSWGAYKCNPVVSHNYKENFDSTSALAHELGHAVHSYLADNNNSYQDADYKIIVAEIASLTNEIILSRYMIEHSKDKNEKLSILNNLLSLYTSNFFGSLKGAEFERIVHQKSDNNEVITADILNETWDNLMKKYSVGIVKDNELQKYGWSRINHFYTSFYYYKYAFGISCATYVANKMLNNDKDILDKYFKFLKAGDSIYPIDAVKILGIDMNSKDIFIDTIKFFDSQVMEFERIYNS